MGKRSKKNKSPVRHAYQITSKFPLYRLLHPQYPDASDPSTTIHSLSSVRPWSLQSYCTLRPAKEQQERCTTCWTPTHFFFLSSAIQDWSRPLTLSNKQFKFRHCKQLSLMKKAGLRGRRCRLCLWDESRKPFLQFRVALRTLALPWRHVYRFFARSSV